MATSAAADGGATPNNFDHSVVVNHQDDIAMNLRGLKMRVQFPDRGRNQIVHLWGPGGSEGRKHKAAGGRITTPYKPDEHNHTLDPGKGHELTIFSEELEVIAGLTAECIEVGIIPGVEPGRHYHAGENRQAQMNRAKTVLNRDSDMMRVFVQRLDHYKETDQIKFLVGCVRIGVSWKVERLSRNTSSCTKSSGIVSHRQAGRLLQREKGISWQESENAHPSVRIPQRKISRCPS